MAYQLEVYVVDAGDETIKVKHTFYGTTERECETYFREHQGSCEYFRTAVQQDRVIEVMEEIDDSELPDPAEFEDDEEG